MLAIVRIDLLSHHMSWMVSRSSTEKCRYFIHFYHTEVLHLLVELTTDGGSKIEAGQRLEQDGYPAKKMPQIIFIDRQQGASKLLRKAGYKQTEIIFNLLDITYVYRKLGLWSPESVKKVEDEIAAHQLI